MSNPLPSWREGATRDAILDFLDRAEALPPEARLACFDNDGTLWCERPTYVQWDFFVDALTHATATDPDMGKRPEFEAVLAGDHAAVGELGLERVAVALAGLFEGATPEEFARSVRRFMSEASHAQLDRPLTTVVYTPMLELIGALRVRGFTVAIVTGGGSEFVRTVAPTLYGVPPELVVGTRIDHRMVTEPRTGLVRTSTIVEGANEGAAKVRNVQAQLGRRPLVAGGNSEGDRELLDWAVAGGGMGILVDHDDAAREYAYPSRLRGSGKAVRDVATTSGWVVVSMEQDWVEVFPPVDASRSGAA